MECFADLISPCFFPFPFHFPFCSAFACRTMDNVSVKLYFVAEGDSRTIECCLSNVPSIPKCLLLQTLHLKVERLI